jgi:hypothetical protein
MYKTALNMDPNNAALKRAVDMAEWISAWHAKHDAQEKALQAPLQAIAKHDAPAAKAALTEVKTQHPEWAPKNEDLEFLFNFVERPRAVDPDQRRFEADMFKPAAVASPLDRQRTVVLSVAQELYWEANLSLFTVERSSYDKKMDQSKAVWRAAQVLK